jgi:hypothetical protein
MPFHALFTQMTKLVPRHDNEREKKEQATKARSEKRQDKVSLKRRRKQVKDTPRH